MSVAELVCQYCSHRNTGAASRCGHCGAPLSERLVEREAQHMAKGAAKVTEAAVVGAERVATDAEHVAAGAAKAVGQYPRWQWLGAFGGVAAVLLALVVSVSRSCSVMPSLPDVDAAQSLPLQLRAAASCQQSAAASSAQQCVIQASNPMLAGGITGGRDLTLTVQLDSSAHITETVNRWRAGGGTVLSDGAVFVAIGPSATVWYANPLSGVRVETGSFTGRVGAQTFLSRSGLTQ
ncbi:hypothetical protein OG874_22335 [Nocardia sp. NBC_00565]|uniref:hypothetical protein n=1 Tax=Nocardia sp. NBC_00565 TaxID=2975993 RepID=UPI002E8223F9|nr:hypothetical protein [Nocardia sp. NBC_00565]WUC07657.1 hypothetical protein OG874_22335 [Nocardia sp. NBC_00565]